MAKERRRPAQHPDWDENQRLQSEKEVLGFFVSGHPLDKYAEKLRNLNVVDTATALEMKVAPAAGRRRAGNRRACWRSPA
jgi:DNA polymerase III alpha subunit